MHPQMRIARPVADLVRSSLMYQRGLGLEVIAQFEDHDGFDGTMLGFTDCPFHFEFTHCRSHPVPPSPTQEDLVVFYLPDITEWETACDRMLKAGFEVVASLNPYWDARGKTFLDPDGYRTVLQNAAWD